MILTLYRDQCVCVVTVMCTFYSIWPNAGARIDQLYTVVYALSCVNWQSMSGGLLLSLPNATEECCEKEDD